MTLRSNLS